MNRSQSGHNDETRNDELGGTLFAAVEATSRRQADEATVGRVIERASQLASASPVGGASWSDTVTLSSRRSSASRRWIAIVASSSGVAAVVVCLAVGLLLIPRNRSAFAQLQAELAKVRTIQFVYRLKGPAEQPPGRVFVVEPYRCREELPDGRVLVTDLQSKQVMKLNAQSKSGEIYSLYDARDRERRTAEMISTLRDAPRNSVETIGRRQVEGRDVIDYRIVDRDGATLKVTVDAVSRLPVRIESSVPHDAERRLICTDFVFDQPIDGALVRIAAPEGYQMTQIKSAARPEADELVVSSEGIGPVKWGMQTADVVKLVGQADGIKPFDFPILDGNKKPIGKKTGEELIYDSRGFRVIVDKHAGVELIDCYGGALGDRARTFTGRTDKGIRMRATPDEVSKAYGEPELRGGMTADVPNGRWDYLKDGLSISFFDNVVSHIEVRGPRLRPNKQGVLAVPIPK